MLKNLGSWCLDNQKLSISLFIYFILQVLTSLGAIPTENIEKLVPAFFAAILLVISLDSQKHGKQLDELMSRLSLDKIEFIDRTSSFFGRLITIIDEKSRVDVLYVSKSPLTAFKHPTAQKYRDKIGGLIKGHPHEFTMRRLFIVNSNSIADSICELYEEYKDCPSLYMRAMETDLDLAFTGYVIVNKRYCFVILPRLPDSDLKCLFIDSETVSAAFLERYDELWKASNIVNDQYCLKLKSNYPS